MTTILFMVSVALILSFVFVSCYLWAMSSGQFDDAETPALRMLKEDYIIKNTERNINEKQ
jgi:cbb3-type cytochrome oxidase maturation protein